VAPGIRVPDDIAEQQHAPVGLDTAVNTSRVGVLLGMHERDDRRGRQLRRRVGGKDRDAAPFRSPASCRR
jgi:hypothetical protein